MKKGFKFVVGSAVTGCTSLASSVVAFCGETGTGYLSSDLFTDIANNIKADIITNITPAGLTIYGTLFAISVAIACFSKFRRA